MTLNKPNQGSKTRLGFVLGGLAVAVIFMQLIKSGDIQPAPTAPVASAPAPQQCSANPFEAFETGKVYVSGELSALVDKVCPVSKWMPNQTIQVQWQSRDYLLTTVKLPFDGVARHRLDSIRLIEN